MLGKLIVAILGFSCASIAQTTDDDSTGAGIIYGDDHAFAVSAPKGWVLDNSSGVNQGLHAVFYPKGGSWKTSPVVMYVNTAHKSVEGNGSLEELMEFDSTQSHKREPSIKIGDLPSLITKDNKPARVRGFISSNHEAVAYIDEEKIVSMICLTARTLTEYESAFPAFKELVSSYWFMTTDVTFPK